MDEIRLGVESNPWLKLVVKPLAKRGIFEIDCNRDYGDVRLSEFDLLVGLEGTAGAHLLGRRIELQKDRLLLLPPGVAIRLRGDPRRRCRMLLIHYDCIVRGRPVRNALRYVDAKRFTLTLRGLPAISLTAGIDANAFYETFQLASRSYSEDLREFTLAVEFMGVLRRLREAHLSPRQSLARERLEKAVNYFKNHLGERVATAAVHSAVSPATLGRLFRAYYRLSPMEFLTRQRLIRARDLLCSGRLNVSEAGYAAGFSSPQYFSRVFKRAYGVAPVEFLKKQRHTL